MVEKDFYDKFQSDVKEMSHAEKMFAWRTLSVQLRLTHDPNSWDELIKLWSDDLTHKKSLIEWLKAYWHIPKRRMKYDDSNESR